jgi:hypothetical protein
MGCRCAERARIVLGKLGYTLGSDGSWRNPNGHCIIDADLEDRHTRITVAALWLRFKSEMTATEPSGAS